MIKKKFLLFLFICVVICMSSCAGVSEDSDSPDTIISDAESFKLANDLLGMDISDATELLHNKFGSDNKEFTQKSMGRDKNDAPYSVTVHNMMGKYELFSSRFNNIYLLTDDLNGDKVTGVGFEVNKTYDSFDSSELVRLSSAETVENIYNDITQKISSKYSEPQFAELLGFKEKYYENSWKDDSGNDMIRVEYSFQPEPTPAGHSYLALVFGSTDHCVNSHIYTQEEIDSWD